MVASLARCFASRSGGISNRGLSGGAGGGFWPPVCDEDRKRGEVIVLRPR